MGWERVGILGPGLRNEFLFVGTRNRFPYNINILSCTNEFLDKEKNWNVKNTEQYNTDNHDVTFDNVEVYPKNVTL